MARHSSKRTQRRLIVILLGLSALAIVVPMPASLRGLMQVLVPLQHGLDAVVPESEAHLSLTDQQASDLLRRAEGLENTVASLLQRNDELQAQNKELSRIRHLGYDGRLIVAQVVAHDSLTWRSSALLDRGVLTGVHQGEAVVSRFFEIRKPDNGRVEEGMSVLAAEILVGEVVEVNSYTARVLLATDAEIRPRLVRIVSVRDGEPAVMPDEFWLYGTDQDRMEVRGVTREYVAQHNIQIGDAVVTSQSDPSLPCAVHVGRIHAMRPDDDIPTLYNIEVQPKLDLRRIKKVYVVDTMEGEGPQG
jgi:cell shape-determining protein MreC